VDAVSRITIASMGMPIELGDDVALEAYNHWFETNVLEPLKTLSPQSYGAVVEYIRAFVERGREEGNDEEKK